jgi:hypothetical protein
MLEIVGFWMIVGGIALAAIAYLWLVVNAFRTRVLWGLALLLFPPSALVFICLHFRKALVPLLVMVLAGAVVGAPYAVNSFSQHFIDLGPYEKVVDGERHLTLTGWDRKDYSVLDARPDTIVLQMANADVDDKTLEHLRGMKRLRELDLSDTQVTDAGLPVLADLPNLETLRLRNTHITDEGFQKCLADKETLMELDLQSTQVASKTARTWKNAKEGRKYLR